MGQRKAGEGMGVFLASPIACAEQWAKRVGDGRRDTWNLEVGQGC